jgi:hypothetical protein
VSTNPKPNPNPKKPQKIDLDYYQWLIGQIKVGTKRTYLGLFEIMHNTEFVWFVPNDGNRLGDGEELRKDYFRYELDSIYEEGILDIEFVSFLEVLIGLSRRLAWGMSDSDNPQYWAWHLIKNLGLSKMSDPLTIGKREQINETLYNVIWRSYHRDGSGGFFPLQKTIKDQTKVEIWYQMQEYLIEKNP